MRKELLDELRKSGEVTDFDLESQVGGGEMMAVEGDGKPGRVDAGVEVTGQSDVVLVEGEDVCDAGVEKTEREVGEEDWTVGREVGGELKPVNCMVGHGDSVRGEESAKSKDFGARKLSGRKLSSLVIEVENWRMRRNVGQSVVSTPRVSPSE